GGVLDMAARSVLVTGASSGIGRALALAYAEPGARLTLIGRDAGRLDAVADAARRKGAEVTTGLIDVRDRAAMAEFLRAEDARRPFDLAVANAGITTGLKPGEIAEDPEATRALIAANLFGVLNTAEPLIGPMCARGAGQLAFVGSIAGLIALPYSPAYCLSKAAVHAWADSLRGRLEPAGVCVSLIVAGFVKTPLNDSIEAMKPFELSDTDAAALIRRGLDRRRATIAFPWPLYALARFGRLLPRRIVDRVLARVEVNAPHTRERAP
uniref:SDR family NAD(P)-dependent oxidoreductase n=1 Tax=Methylocella sp. TaxID=1978226 RepID=UPI003784FB4A